MQRVERLFRTRKTVFYERIRDYGARFVCIVIGFIFIAWRRYYTNTVTLFAITIVNDAADNGYNTIAKIRRTARLRPMPPEVQTLRRIAGVGQAPFINPFEYM